MAAALPKHVQESKDHTQVEYRRLGNSGLRVSLPILGAMSIGTPDWAPWVINEEQSVALLKAAFDRGVNTWDTANAYANGYSERVIAQALKQHHIPRHKVVILTKCFFGAAEDVSVNAFAHSAAMRDTRDYVNQLGLSRQAIFAQVEDSLARLHTHYIDLLQIHRFDYNTPIEETMEALHDLVRMGKVRYIGASSMWAYQFAMMQACAEKHGWTKFVSMQNQYNMLYREEEREMIKFCNATGVGLIPWAPLCRGHLARPLASWGATTRSGGEKEANASATGPSQPVDRKIIERVEEIAKKKGWTMTDVALAWTNKRVTSPIIGFSKVERIDEALHATGKTLTDEEEKYLEELYEPKNVVGHA